MPNTPAMVGEGCCALCLDDPTLNEEQKKLVLELFSAISTTVVLHESHIPEFSAFIGSGRPSSFTCWSRSWKLGCASASLTTMLNSSQKN